jgi:peptide/nickel transport system substrate-binding protein
MKRNVISVLLACCVITSLVLASCSGSTQTTQPATTQTAATQTTTTRTTTIPTTIIVTSTTASTIPAAATPLYGGTLTLFTVYSYQDTPGWDFPMTVNLSTAAEYANPFLEWPLVGDIEKYGPRGTNAFAFNTWEMVPEQYLGGSLAESWEVSPNGQSFTFHVRHGVMWTGNQKIGMAPRELTADDIVSSQKRALTRPGFAASFAWLKSISSTDKYTVVWTCNTYYVLWSWRMCGTVLGAIMAPETVAAGPTDWKNAVGTGPFILSDYVAGSGATYTRNTNYWGTANINGKNYQLPFIQTLIYPVIPDPSTQIAALRTGKIDWDPRVNLTNQNSLTSSAPNLIQNKYLSGSIYMYKFNRLTSQYFSNLSLRRALMIGTDLNSIANLVFNGGEIHSWPIGEGVPGYTPLDQLPASQKELYTYDAPKAKQMIAAAGYPNGFNIEIAISSSDSTEQDLASACAGMWAQIGVKATIKVMDPTAYGTAYANSSFKDGLIYPWAVVNPFVAFNQARSDVSGAIYKAGESTNFDTKYQTASSTVDAVQRTALVKQFALDFLDDAAVIPFANSYSLNCYWPWLKNYYGEVEASYYNQIPMVKLMWIDQNLKKSLGK